MVDDRRPPPPPPMYEPSQQPEPLPVPDLTPLQYGQNLQSMLSESPMKILGWFAGSFGILWVVFGLAGFAMSLVCFGYSGNVGEKILGVILSIILGPLFWLYYYASSSYCKAAPSFL